MPLPHKSSTVKFWEIFKFSNSCGRECNKMHYQKLYTHAHKGSICIQCFCAFFSLFICKGNKYMTEAQITTKFLATLIFVCISSSQVIVYGLRSAGHSLRNNTLHNTQHKQTLIKCELLLYLLSSVERADRESSMSSVNE